MNSNFWNLPSKLLRRKTVGSNNGLKLNHPNETASRTILFYASSVIIGVFGLSYGFVPFYRLVCSATGIGGTPQVSHSVLDKTKMRPLQEKVSSLKIEFDSTVSGNLPWSFTPSQRCLEDVIPGTTILAFYQAKNLSSQAINGFSTYNVMPSKAAAYLNKIQCFCFEEQRLEPGEIVDMPIFFYIDPDFSLDPDMEDVKEILLSYTFFRAPSH